MPSISLLVCIHNQGTLLQRLLDETAGCYDDLVVVHDGPETMEGSISISALVDTHGGRFFFRTRAYQQEPHWPFAWGQAKQNWILRLDADEFPSREMKTWLMDFRKASEPRPDVSGYTCIWPLWNGRREVSRNYSRGRIFLFHRDRVRFFGMVEQVPIPDGHYQPLNLLLHHQPRRKSYGIHSMLLRKCGNEWRRRIARSLLGTPRDLNCWRWESETWPAPWEEIRQRPLKTALRRLMRAPFRSLKEQWKYERKLFPLAALTAALHHALICFQYWRATRKRSPRMS